MATRVLLTIDTELTWRHHVAGCSWQENYARSVEPGGVGLGYQIAKLNAHGLKACFFIDPMPALLFGLDPVKRMVETVREGGQGIQLHLHPMWAGARKGGGCAKDTRFELTEYGHEDQRALIEQARDLLVRAGAPEPVAFRAGSYAANEDTLRSLRDLGFRYDTSHNGCEAPWPSALDLPAEQITPVREKGVTEIPVTQLALPGGGLRHIQICAVSLAEMRAALDHAVAQELPVVTLVGHSFELAARDGLRPNRVVKARFDRLCALLEERSATMPTLHFADLERVPIGVDAEPARVSRFTVAGRMAAQLWSNVVEERTG